MTDLFWMRQAFKSRVSSPLGLIPFLPLFKTNGQDPCFQSCPLEWYAWKPETGAWGFSIAFSLGFGRENGCQKQNVSLTILLKAFICLFHPPRCSRLVLIVVWMLCFGRLARLSLLYFLRISAKTLFQNTSLKNFFNFFSLFSWPKSTPKASFLLVFGGIRLDYKYYRFIISIFSENCKIFLAPFSDLW